MCMSDQRSPLLDSVSPHALSLEDVDDELLNRWQSLELTGDIESSHVRHTGPAGGHTQLDEEDVYEMKELITEKPQDAIQYLEEEGMLKLGEMQLNDNGVLRALVYEGILTAGSADLDVDWVAMWKQRLSSMVKGMSLESDVGWKSTLTLEAYVVNLKDATAEGRNGLLHPLLSRYKAKGCSSAVFGLPAVQAVIHFKWSNWVKRALTVELLLYLTWLLAFTAFSVLYVNIYGRSGEDDAKASATSGLLGLDFTGQVSVQSLSPYHTRILMHAGALASLAIATLAMGPFLYMEGCTIRVYGRHWVSFNNMTSVLTYVLQLVVVVSYMVDQGTGKVMDRGWFPSVVAAQCVLLWTGIQYYARVFNPTKNLFVDTIRIVIGDMKWFLLFLTMVMMGFAFAFYALFKDDRDKFMDFKNLWHSFASMFSYILAMFDYNTFYGSSNPVATMILFVIFEFIVYIILLNVLIAVMTSAFNKVTEDEGLRFLISKATIIDELETTLPKWIRSYPEWYPSFVHVLKVSPESRDDVNLHSLWSGMGMMENNLMNAQQEMRLRVEEMETNIKKINKRLDLIVKLLHRQTRALSPAPSNMMDSRLRGIGGSFPSAPGSPRGMEGGGGRVSQDVGRRPSSQITLGGLSEVSELTMDVHGTDGAGGTPPDAGRGQR